MNRKKGRYIHDYHDYTFNRKQKIIEYRGIVFGEVVNGVDFVKDFTAGITNFFGGRSGSYEGELIDARQHAIDEMVERAKQFGAAVIVE